MKNRLIRIHLVLYFFTFLFLALSFRIYYLQIFRKTFLRKLSKSQYYKRIPFESKRGKIFDRNGMLLATGINVYSVYCEPLLIENPLKTADILLQHIDLPKKKLFSKLNSGKRFVWIKRKISWQEKEEIKSLGLKGIGFIREEMRFYPQGKLALSIIGAVNIDNIGIEGLEFIYDSYLRGKNGWVEVLKDSASRDIILSPQVIDPQCGTDVALTIDGQIQYWLETYLQEVLEEFDASGADAIVMDANSGQLLAIASHKKGKISEAAVSRVTRNAAICDMFEPGSVFKVVTLLAAIENNKFNQDDIIFCENGKLKIPGSVLHDFRPYGNLTFREVFKKSSNIGVSKIAAAIGEHDFYRYILKLGFGKKTGIDLPGEAAGKIRPVREWSNTSRYIIPVGQEVGVNLLQLVRMLASVCNGGYLVKPYIAKDIRTQLVVRKTEDIRSRVFSEDVAAIAKDILIEVVEDGTGKGAFIEGQKIGGKTGTAQKYDPAIKRYSPKNYRATFIGFISSMDPPVVIGVSVDEPQKSHFGGVVAAPVFKKIASKVLAYQLNVSDLAKTLKPDERAEEVSLSGVGNNDN
ncbi:MAG: penicillin-binding protein 2 [Candidatus Omnitrophota bacterium]